MLISPPPVPRAVAAVLQGLQRSECERTGTSKTKYPEGWELIEPTLTELETKMREAEADSHEGKRKVESIWPVFRISHQRSRYIYDLFYRRKAISRELYDFCLDQGYGDKNLIAKWKKQGYERLCCLRCIQSKDTTYGTVCICRVPKKTLNAGSVVECQHCGCRGCAVGDSNEMDDPPPPPPPGNPPE